MANLRVRALGLCLSELRRRLVWLALASEKLSATDCLGCGKKSQSDLAQLAKHWPGSVIDLCEQQFFELQTLDLEGVRHFSAVFRQLDHHLLVQPNIHRGRVIHIASVIQFLSQLLARGQAAIEVE